MKNSILLILALTVNCFAYNLSAATIGGNMGTTAPATVKPQWTFNFPTALKSSYGWGILRWVSDAYGNTAITCWVAQDQSGSNYTYDVFWISSQGKLLGTIKNFNMGGGDYIIGLNASSLISWDTDSDGFSNGKGNPYALIKWTIQNGNLVRSPFLTGDFAQGRIPTPFQSGILEVSETDGSGNPKQFSFYPY
jgi:hypothetical protein